MDVRTYQFLDMSKHVLGHDGDFVTSSNVHRGLRFPGRLLPGSGIEGTTVTSIEGTDSTGGCVQEYTECPNE